MLAAKDIMTANPVTIGPSTGVKEAVALLLEKHFNGLPVVDDQGMLVGVLCQSDLVAQQKKLETPSVFSILDGFLPAFGWKEAEKDIQKITALTVEEAMTKNPVTVAPDLPLDSVATLMLKHKYYSLPVVESGRLVGIIGKEDILRTLVEDE